MRIPFHLEDYWQRWKRQVNAELDRLVPAQEPARLYDTMRYAALTDGKRLRPILAVATAEALGCEAGPFIPAFVVLELLHAVSLVCDDLPAMDDDDLRRGKPSCHKAFDEAHAILASNGLFAMLFHVLAGLDVPADVRLALMSELSNAALLMVKGQAIDLSLTGSPGSAEVLERLHNWKTASLIVCSVRFGAILAGYLTPPAAFDDYAWRLGLAYQISDDILDATRSAEELGKTPGKDAAAGKLTYVTKYGLAGAEALLEETVQAAEAAVAAYGEAGEPLRALARLLVVRTQGGRLAGDRLSPEDLAARDAAMRDVEADLALVEQDYNAVLAKLDGSLARYGDAALVRESLARNWREPLRHALLAKGKFLRPMFTYWFFRGYVGPVAPLLAPDADERQRELLRHARGIGTAIELSHTASLVLDDIVDDSAERRDAPTVHRRFGTPLGLNTGMALAFMGFEQLGDSPAKQLALDFVIDSYAGQALDLGQDTPAQVQASFRATAEERWALYLQTARLKASRPLAFSVMAMTRLVEVPEAELRRLDEALDKLGLAHQALNDLRDFSPMFGQGGEDAGLKNMVCLHLLARLDAQALAAAEAAYVAGGFGDYVLDHPAFGAAWEGAIAQAKTWLEEAEAALVTCGPLPEGRAYLGAIFHHFLREPLGLLEADRPVAAAVVPRQPQAQMSGREPGA